MHSNPHVASCGVVRGGGRGCVGVCTRAGACPVVLQLCVGFTAEAQAVCSRTFTFDKTSLPKQRSPGWRGPALSKP